MLGKNDIRKHWIFQLREDDEIIEGLGSYMIVSKSKSGELPPPTFQPRYGNTEPGSSEEITEGKADCS